MAPDVGKIDSAYAHWLRFIHTATLPKIIVDVSYKAQARYETDYNKQSDSGQALQKVIISLLNVFPAVDEMAYEE